jgi:chloramphenicol 3-O-phosphotransferase
VKQKIIVITGIMAAGKSTVAQALAERIPDSVHLRGDVFRRMIVSGREDMSSTPSDRAVTQLRLRYRLSVSAARGYLADGFSVVHQDNILGSMLTEVVGLYAPQPVHVVVLCPRPEVVARREAARPKRGYVGYSVCRLDAAFRAETPRLGLWLDNSDLTVAETVERILGDLESARVNAGAERLV